MLNDLKANRQILGTLFDLLIEKALKCKYRGLVFLPFTEGKAKSQYPFMNRDPSVKLDVNENPHEILN
jgi:hypothetical protein